MVAVDGFTQVLQERDGVQVLAPTEAIRNPLALTPPVVEIQHRGHSIHAQRIRVIGLEPEQRAAAQEIAHLRATVVEDRAVPLRVESLARISVLVQVSPVKVRESMLVRRKVRGHPVEYHTDATPMQMIDEVHEVLRRAV